MQDIDRQLAVIASRQHSLIRLDQVVAVGGNRHHAAARVASGRWELLSPGVYRIAGTPMTYEAEVLALVFAAGDGACASHFCALRLLGIGFPHAEPEISIPRGHFHRPKGKKVHTSTDLDRCQIVERNGIPVTDPARSLLDAARKLRGVALKHAVEQARRDDLVTWHDLIACVAAHARSGRHGVRRLREVIATGAAVDEITETDSELAAVGLLIEHGFGVPRLQRKLFDDDGRLVANMDIAYDTDRVDFEIDGPVHLDPAVRLRDEARDQEVRRRFGWTVRRIWYEIPVRDPRLFLAIVRETFAEARAKNSCDVP
ncbi:MAG: hypothetical protein QOG90_1357 [Actinomycetota bacterium]